MARIIESSTGSRRIIKMSVDDILSVVQDYQRIVPRFSNTKEARSYLSDTVIYIPEDVQQQSDDAISASAFFASSKEGSCSRTSI